MSLFIYDLFINLLFFCLFVCLFFGCCCCCCSIFYSFPVLWSPSQYHLMCMHVIFYLCTGLYLGHCPPGRPTLQADGVFLFKIKSIYLSILSRSVDKDSNCTELCHVVHVCSAGFAACTCPTTVLVLL